MKKKTLLLPWIALLLIASPLAAEITWIEDYDIYFDPLEDWILLDGGSPESFSMTNSSYQVFFQSLIKKSTGDQASRIQDIESRLGATESEWVTWVWQGAEAALGSFTFETPYGLQQAYALNVLKGENSLTLLAFTQQAYFESYADDMLSVLDSLAIDSASRRQIGPLSAYLLLEPTSTSFDEETLLLELGGQPVELSFTPGALDNQLVTIEREARIIQRYVNTPYLALAWSRYYRIIYRQGYQELSALAQVWQGAAQKGLIAPEDLPQAILSWLQTFEYSRRGGLSDLYPVTQSLLQQEGDCDSLALIYATLLDHLGYRNILMVSAEYAHAMVGIDLPGDGARFPFLGTDYLVAELTDDVQLGMIVQDMADPSFWLGIDLWGQP
jgi:hypothetical protein